MRTSSKQKNPKAGSSEENNNFKQKVLKKAISKGIIDGSTGLVRAIIETTKGCRNKYSYVPKLDLFECGPALKAGLSWPFDFGFIPKTLAADGDPLDIIILMDEPAFPGCLVHVKIIGVVEAEQISNGQTIRNDRVIGVHNQSIEFGQMNSWRDLPPHFREETEMFFEIYNKAKGRPFKLLGWRDSTVAYELIESAIKGKNS